MGCSFMPSPPLMTDARTFFAKSAGAPPMGWRMTMTSFFIASSVRPVSMSVSPFCTELDEADTFTVPAPRYLAASSKEQRVLVLFS